MKRYVIARADEFPPGTRRIVDIDGRSIGVFNVDGTYYALRNSCPHQGAALCTGQVLGSVTSPAPGEYHYDAERKLLTCPWHNWEFDLATGQSWFDPAKTRVKPYEVAVESGATIAGAGGDGGGTGAGGEGGPPAGGGRGGPDAEDGRRPGPYVAETLTVTVDGDYVVVTP